MLPKISYPKPNSSQNRMYGKYATKKPMMLKPQVDQSDKQNQQNSSNIHPTVDITKKIRKRSPKKHLKSTSTPTLYQNHQKFNGFPVFKQSELDLDIELSHMIQPQRIDNDVDTDQEQMMSGIDKMVNFIRQACLERMYDRDDLHYYD